MSATERKRQLQRNAETGKIAGVCAGLADYLNIETWVVRLIFSPALFSLKVSFSYCISRVG